MNKILILLLLVLLVGCSKGAQIRDDYTLIKDRKHVFEYTSAENVIRMLNSKDTSAIIVFSFVACPWCQESLPRVNQIAKELAIKKVYLLDIRQMRDEKTKEYLDIFEIVKDQIEFAKGSKEKQRINVPTIIALKDGEIVGSHLSTLKSHVLDEDKLLPPMTTKQEEEFKMILKDLLNKIK